MTKETNKYKVINFKQGKYDYNTLFIDVEGVEYQIPCKKNIKANECIGKEIVVNNLYKVIEKIVL